MQYLIENDHLKITVSEAGAQLESILSMQDGFEYLWQGEASFWRRKAPILFPIVGALKDKTIDIGGNAYEMGQHGFARDQQFRCIVSEKEKLVFVLTANETTKKHYPYAFELKIEYLLEANTLKVRYTVSNDGEEEMYYSIGAHPGFNVDYPATLTFEKAESTELFEVNPSVGLIKPRKSHLEGFGESTNRFELTAHSFTKDAYIFETPRSAYWTLSSKLGKSVTMTCEKAPYLGIWNDGGPFVCLEPWWGIADFENTTGCIEDKVGMRRLATEQLESVGYDLTFC